MTMRKDLHVKTHRIKHEAIQQYMLENPTVPQSDVAEAFDVSYTYLSRLINSDAFQEQLKIKQELMFSRVMDSTSEKVEEVANLALEKLAKKIPVTESVDSLTSTADKMLKNLGYGAPRAGGSNNGNTNIQQNFYASPEQARSLIGASKPNGFETHPQGGETIEGTADPATPIQGPGGEAWSQAAGRPLRTQVPPPDGEGV